MEENVKENEFVTIAKKLWEKIKKFVRSGIKQIFVGFGEAIKDEWGNLRETFSEKKLREGFRIFLKNFTHNFDIVYLCVVIALVVYGLIVLSSAGDTGTVLNQIIFVAGGILAMLIISNLKVETIKKISPFLMFIATILLFLVFTRADYNGTHRRFFGMQPSELGKVTLIMWLAYLMDRHKKSKDKPSAFLTFLIITAAYGVLIAAESHLSGCLLYLCIGYAMMWYADMNKKCFAGVTAFVIVVFLVAVWKPEIIPGVKDYQLERIVIWKKILFNGELTSNEKLNKARQVLQSLYGIGSGGLLGVGYGNSGQKISNLQEKDNDFIFAVLGEELGFIGAILMLAAYAALVYLGFKIAFKTKTTYGRLVALGISTQMALQVLINVAVATSLLPNTGISLPFFSNGGSSMVVNLASMGIMLSISKDSGQVKKDA